MHQLRFTLTGDNLAAVEHLATSMAADYFGPDYEPLLTSSKAVRNRNPANGVVLDGWNVTFTYHCRPAAQPIRPRRSDLVRAVPNTEPDIVPYGDGHPTEGAA